MKNIASLSSVYLLWFLQFRFFFLAHHAWCMFDLFRTCLVQDLPNLPVESLPRLLVIGARVELDFSGLFQPLKELHGPFVPFLLQEVYKHHLEIHSFAVFGKAYINLVYEFSVKPDVECIAHIDFVVVSRNAWNADGEHSVITEDNRTHLEIFLSILSDPP